MSTAMRAIQSYAHAPFRAYLEDLIRARGLTANGANEAIFGAARSDVHRVLNGAMRLTPRSAPRWAEVLGVTPETLLERQPPKLERAKAKARPRSKRITNLHPLNVHVRRLLEEKNMGVKDLATALGHKTTAPLGAVLTGGVSFTPTMAERLAKVLNISPESLLAVTQKSSEEPKTRKNPARVVVGPPVMPKARPVLDQGTFSMTIGSDGLASVHLHLNGLAVNVALEIVSALNLPAILGSSKDLLKITGPTRHDRSR